MPCYSWLQAKPKKRPSGGKPQEKKWVAVGQETSAEVSDHEEKREDVSVHLSEDEDASCRSATSEEARRAERRNRFHSEQPTEDFDDVGDTDGESAETRRRRSGDKRKWVKVDSKKSGSRTGLERSLDVPPPRRRRRGSRREAAAASSGMTAEEATYEEVILRRSEQLIRRDEEDHM
jgi:hypothetical protein